MAEVRMNPWATAYPNPYDDAQLLGSETPLGPQGPLTPPEPRSPASQREITSTDREKLMMLLKLQQDATNRQMQSADEYAAVPQKMDLSPIMALADGFTGSKFSSSYQKPTSPDDHKAIVAKLRDLASGSQEKVTETALKMYLGDSKSEDAYTKMMRQTAHKGLTDSLQIRLDKDLREDLQGNVQKPLQLKLEGLNQIHAGLKNVNTNQALNTVISQYARQVSGEGSRLTQEDIERAMAPNINQIYHRIRDFFSSHPGQNKLPPEFNDGLEKMVQWTKLYAAKRFSQDMQIKRKIYTSQKSYKAMMQPGESGDTSFKAIEDHIENIRPVAETLLTRPPSVDEDHWTLMDEPERESLVRLQEQGLLKAKPKGRK